MTGDASSGRRAKLLVLVGLVYRCVLRGGRRRPSAISKLYWLTFVPNGTLRSHDWTQGSGAGRTAARRIVVGILVGLAAHLIPITATMTWAHWLYRVGAATRTAAAVEVGPSG